MPGLARKMASDNWDGPFIARLRRYIDLVPGDIDDLRSLLESDLRIEKRRDLVVDGYEYRKLCFIRDGFAARYKVLRNGKRQIVSILVPGDVVGLPGSFLDHATFSVIALSDMRLEVCSLEDFVALCYRRPKFGLALSWLGAHEATMYAEHIIDLGRRSSIERLAHFLLEIHARLLVVGRAGELEFDLPVSQEIMSDVLGLSVPHLNRMLAKLRGDGLVAMDGRHVSFVDAKALRRLAQFQPATLTRIPAAPSPAVILRAPLPR
jgi:CRP-like cAMP-binding protein